MVRRWLRQPHLGINSRNEGRSEHSFSAKIPTAKISSSMFLKLKVWQRLWLAGTDAAGALRRSLGYDLQGRYAVSLAKKSVIRDGAHGRRQNHPTRKCPPPSDGTCLNTFCRTVGLPVPPD
ncbi:hypothetical protein S40293_10597 [Stachybotrys chartarum IBT 40293]|nr:hypothetical protein S40293_10597 [Stachybotrys chartarum IBT 40293]